MRKIILIAGPCVIESFENASLIAESLKKITNKYCIDYYFKASFDKANRTSLDSFRGPGVEEGLIPHQRSLDEDEKNIEEERRLFYVAITRAREKLILSSCQNRRKQGMIIECEPSRFLDEIPEHLVEYHNPEEPVSDDKAKSLFSNMLKNLQNGNK